MPASVVIVFNHLEIKLVISQPGYVVLQNFNNNQDLSNMLSKISLLLQVLAPIYYSLSSFVSSSVKLFVPLSSNGLIKLSNNLTAKR